MEHKEHTTEKSAAALRPSSGDGKSLAAGREEAVLKFWKENDIFKKTLDKKTEKEFVFFEGPPTANAKPALHHLEARAFKDVLPRYKTMQGFHVRRKAGWDTHGLPVELQIEKKLGLKSKKEIVEYGIAQFNKECRESVFEFIGDWEKFTERIGYWVDKNDAYYTFDANYVESLWSIFAKVNERGLVYKDYRIVPWCPRCGTALASHELAQGYQDDKDLSVIAKFKIVGFDGAYFLAWTTTPWTLPGNVGLAVGNDIDYVEAKVTKETGTEILVLAKERLSVLTEPYEIIAEHKGSEMVGMAYEPLYPYLADQISGAEKEKMKNAYKIYAADFVTTTDGTGIVHTAVMYGQDDFELGTKVGLPKFHLVNDEGHFIKGTEFLENRFVKDEAVAVDIIKDLAHRGLLFKKEKFEHSYPHCWRCKTPLIYYARDSWYIGMSQLRNELLKENEKINWEPSHIQEGRFGEWLREVKDWAISRERYWGTPLPIWQSEDGERIFVDSFETLKNYTEKSGNTYIVMRHGETTGNLRGLIMDDPNEKTELTPEGVAIVKEAARKIKNTIPDLIITSPLDRTQKTAEIMATELGIATDTIVVDERLTEMHLGPTFNGKKWEDYHNLYPKTIALFNMAPEGGESYQSVRRRVLSVVFELEKKYKDKKILIVTHGAPAWLMYTGAQGMDIENTLAEIRHKAGFHYFENAEIREIPFVPFPHNENFELDPHRPYIDDVILKKDGKEFHRVKEVMDVWFDSGAMPFAQEHYPFNHKSTFEPYGGLLKKSHGYPADFISEAIDQTRGWFYTLLAVGVLMKAGTPYKNVICLGLLLDSEGKKMSKSVGNIVDPWMMMEKYGVDALRLWMYSVNQPGDSKNFDEKTVAELNGKVFTLLYNVLSFYELYRDTKLESEISNLKDENVLDAWIMARLNQLIAECTQNLDTYKVLEPVRAIRDFIGDLSTWYLRRSRDRIKEGDADAKKTLYTVLKNVAQLLAPFAPFAAEDIWQKLKNSTDIESVHLSTWPEAQKVTPALITDMETTRKIVSLGLEARQKAKIPVRQPLGKLEIKDLKLQKEYLELIKDELNVKEIVENKTIDDEVKLATEISDELKKEGEYRELVRKIQDIRKEQDLTPSDTIELTLPESYKEIVTQFEENLKKTVLAKTVTFSANNEIKIKK